MSKQLFGSVVRASLLITALSFPLSTLAADENNVAPGLTAAGAPLGLHGADPVATIKIGNPVEGSAVFTAVHDGVAYYFSSQANLNSFKSNPARYIPQNGGFCTFGVSKGKKFDGDPQYSSVIDGKLYVFLNEQVFELYLKDQQGTITGAAKNWEKIQNVAATEL